MPYETELIDAVKKNDSKRVEEVLKKGANVNAMDTYQSVFDIAVKNNNPQIVTLLLTKGQNNVYQSTLEKNLFNTFQDEKKRQIAFLIADKMEDASASSQYNPSFVWAALELDWPEVLECVLKKNASCKAKDHFGYDPLHKAISLNRIKCAKILCKYVEDINEFSGQHDAAQWAARMGRAEILEAIIESGANINLTNGSLIDDIKVFLWFSTAFLYTPKLSNWNKVIHYAATSDEPEVIDLLVKKYSDRIDINEPGDDDKTPLIQAIETRSFDTARRLLEYGADPNKTDKIGTALHAAVRINEHRILKMLFDYGVDQRIKGPCGKTALEYAKYREETNCENYDFLIEDLEEYWQKGASIAKQKPFYRNPNNGRGARE